MSGDLRLRVLAELGICPFRENVNDASMCSCGLPALTHDEVAARIVLNDHPAILALLDERDALAARVAALAGGWERLARNGSERYAEIRRAHAAALRAALRDQP